MSHQLCRSGVKCRRSHFHAGTTLQPWVGTRGRSPCLERAPGPCPSTSTLSLRRFLPPPSYPSPTEPRPVPPGHPAVRHSHIPLHCSQEIAWRIRRVSHHPLPSLQRACCGRWMWGQGHPELPAGPTRQEALPPPVPLPVLLCSSGPRNNLPCTLGSLGGCNSK